MNINDYTRKITTFLLFCSFILSGYSRAQTGCRVNGESLQTYFSTYNASHPIIMAHRMSPTKGFAENSLNTLRYNMKYYPCSIQEIDVRITSDGIPILLHDNTLDRTTSGKGNVSCFTYAELQKLNLKDIDGNILPDDHIPLLEDALRIIKGKGIAMLDMKPGTDPEIMMNVVKKTRTFDDIIIICYSIEDAEMLNKKYPDLMLAIGFNDRKGIERNKNSKLPPENLIALVPGVIQEQNYYDSIRTMGVPISFGAQNKADLAPNATELYHTIFEAGITILCTDSISKAYKAFVP